MRRFRGLTASLTYTETGSNRLRAWHAVRVLPGPPRTPIRTGVSWSLTNSAHFAGVSAGSLTGCAVSAAGRGRDSLDFGSRSLGSPNPFLAPAGVALEDRRSASLHVWMAPAWQEEMQRAAQKSLAVMCPACSRSPDGLLALMESANRAIHPIIRSPRRRGRVACPAAVGFLVGVFSRRNLERRRTAE